MYMLQNGPPKVQPSIMKLPAIFVKLSDILPSKNKAPRTGKAWAKDIIKLSFQGLESPSKMSSSKERQSGSPPEPPPVSGATASRVNSELRSSEEADEKAIVIAEACLIKPMPPSLDLVKQRVDKDIAFHPKSGGFAFRLHAKVGESVILPLVERLERVEQLVDFVEVVKKHEKILHCETVSLGQIIFSYGSAAGFAGPSHPDAMSVDTNSSRHRATINFSGANTPMTMSLEPGNPQIRILDHLTKTLNSTVGLNGVATLLPLTLPLMAAFDAIEDAWTSLADRGDVIIFNRAIDWHILRYNLTPDSQEQQPRKVMFQIRLQHRRGQPWWCIRREKESNRGEQKNTNSGDDIDSALKAVWEDNPEGENWRGMQNSGIARIEGVEELVRRVDDVIRSFAIVAAKSVPNVAMELKEMQKLLTPGNRKGQAPQPQQAARNGKKQHDAIVID
jgi:mediator of RNA polymerase II transcription subunit 14